MMGVRTTQVYPLKGEAKFNGNVSAPLYPTNGIRMLLASVGNDNTAGNGITGTPTATSGTTGSAGSSTSFASTGVTSVTLTGISGTFAASQVVQISGSTDAAGGSELCSVTTFSTPTLTISATAKAHTGTITVTVVGFLSTGTVAAGASTITLVAGGGAYFTSNDIVQIDVNTAGGATTAEVHKITKSTDTLTIADASPNNTFAFAHATSVQVVHVGANYTHTVPISNTISSSFTLEKNLGNFQSEQYAGCRIGKYTLNVPMGNSPTNFTADVMGQSVAVLGTPTAVAIDTTPPYVFSEATLTAFGNSFTHASNFKMDLNNQVKAEYTYSQQQGPSYLPATDLIIGGSFDIIWNSHTDSTYNVFTRAQNQTQGALTILLAHAAGYSVQITMPEIVLKLPKTQPKPGELIKVSASFDAFHNISSANPSPATVTLINNQYLSY